jgi:hypothetical protein
MSDIKDYDYIDMRDLGIKEDDFSDVYWDQLNMMHPNEATYYAMGAYISKYPDFPVPAHYAHPIVLKWMQDILAEDRAKDSAGALEILKEDLRKLDSSVTVDQETYEEIMAIKPLFLVS